LKDVRKAFWKCSRILIRMVFEKYDRRYWLLYEWPMGKKGLKGCLYIGIKNVV
jgi:hypothetical protein